MSNTHTLTPDHANVSSETGVDVTVYRHDAERIHFATESRSLSIFLDESDALDVPVNDLMETENKYRTQGPSAFKTHEQLKRELFGD